MVALIDEETQKKGLVAVIYNVDPNWKDTFDAELFAGVGELVKASPLRSVAIHYCFLDSAFGAIVKFISMTLDRNSRTRTRLHHGTRRSITLEIFVLVVHRLISFLLLLVFRKSPRGSIRTHVIWYSHAGHTSEFRRSYESERAFQVDSK
jgi:hypothetical protein